MKKQIPFLSTLFITLCFIFIDNIQLYSQNKQAYNPLVVENAHWEVGFYSTENPLWAPYQMYQYVISGDSILNGNQYKKLYYRDLDDVDPEFILSEELYGFLREDTLSQKVYAIVFNHLNETGCPNNEEYQLYDFDLEVGDTTEMCLVDFWDQWIIYEILYQTLFGEERKVFNTFNSPDYLIEGVGSYSGLLEYGFFVKDSKPESKGGYYELLNFCIGTDEECGYLWVGQEELKSTNGFEIYPNPMVGRKLYLRSNPPINHPVKIVLYNMHGSNVFETELLTLTGIESIELPITLTSSKSPFLLVVFNNDQPVFKQVIIN